MVQPYSSTDVVTTRKNYCFILSQREREREREIRSSYCFLRAIQVHTLLLHVQTPFSVDEVLLHRYINWSFDSRSLLLSEEMASSRLKRRDSALYSHRDQCLLLPVPVYLAKIRLE